MKQQTYIAGRDGVSDDDPLLPKGMDSARYRVLGNAVCVPVAQWIGERLRSVIES